MNPRIRNKSFKFNSIEDVEVFVERLLNTKWYYENHSIVLKTKKYYFEWDMRSRKRLGYCNFTLYKIGISRAIVELNLHNTKAIRAVVLHEIAHAIAFELFEDEGHSETWKKILLHIGGDGKARYDPRELIQPRMKYTLSCQNCDLEIGVTRRPKVQSCGVCDPSGFNSKYKLTVKKNY
jgi:predicted SprT family Zn-dependent metalloprotease